MEENCIFCKIVKGEIPSKKVYENEYVCAFYDVNPVTPVHILIVPKIHIENVNDLNEENINYVSEIFKAIQEVVRICNVKTSGYRIVNNNGDDAGQTVKHLHFHLLAGTSLGEKIIS